MRFDLGQVVGPQGPAGKESITQVSVNGTNGFMKYEKGIGECWGYSTIPAGSGYIDISLPFRFVDNNYCPLVIKYQSGRKGDVYVQYVSADNFRVSMDTDITTEEQHFYYRCIGKI